MAQVTQTPQSVVDGFIAIATNRTLVRLDGRLYGGSREAYLGDRNRIRRDTLAFRNAWREIRWRNPDSLAPALVKAGRWAFSGRLSYDDSRGEWEYCTGQYTPTEIRRAAYQVALAAKAFLSLSDKQP